MASDADFWATAEKVKEFLSEKYCLARMSRSDCGPTIIRAHTIPKSQLRKIATEGHVYKMSATLADLKKTGGRIVVAKEGISNFSILNCFCNVHDSSLFSHLEADELTFDREQIALLHYRAMGAELYKKIGTYRSALSDIEDAKKKPEKERGRQLGFLKPHAAGQYLGLRDMIRTFKLCDKVIMDRDFDAVHALVILFKKMPSIMAVGGFSPEFDFDRKRVQLLGQPERECDQVSVSILVESGRAAVAITWHKDALFKDNFAASLISKPTKLLSSLVIQAAFEHLENTCMNIPWWDQLKEVVRGSLLRRMQDAGGMFEERKNSCLEYCGVTYDEWEYDNHRFVA